jgi:hypothetical protein
MPDILVTPPIRTPLISSNGDTTAGSAPDSNSVIRTTRDWWLYWNRLGAQANSNAKLVTQGTHADRPTATDSPDGALYVETDRGAIYQARNGVWQYLAGTMWGTVTPDQRPTDLGVNDGGFDFRGTDDAREFIWSQTQWIEVTEVRYGTHAGRPNPVDVANGALYVEFDRGGAIYQNQNNVWKYLAGTMWGTLVPDQRPTDLGVDDAGFDFRTTDSNTANAPREFMWSQSQWIEITGALYGTHAARPAANAATPSRTFYVETDRGNVIYQNQGNVWKYLAGTMLGTISPDQRPTDLGANDTGFRFEATDALRTFRWTGSAWTETTPASNTVQLAYLTTALTLTTSAQNIPGCSLTLAKAGTYLVVAVYDLVCANDATSYLIGGMVGQTQVAVFLTPSATGRATVSQQFLVNASAGFTAQLTAWKSGGTGTSTADVRSSISALWVSP